MMSVEKRKDKTTIKYSAIEIIAQYLSGWTVHMINYLYLFV